MPKIDLDGLAVKTLAPGFDAKLIHTDAMTFSSVQCEAGAELPEHSHPQEQVVNVLSGELELVVEGESHLLTRGVVFFLPSNLPHSGMARTQCEVLDVFSPPRDDLK